MVNSIRTTSNLYQPSTPDARLLLMSNDFLCVGYMPRLHCMQRIIQCMQCMPTKMHNNTSIWVLFSWDCHYVVCSATKRSYSVFLHISIFVWHRHVLADVHKLFVVIWSIQTFATFFYSSVSGNLKCNSKLVFIKMPVFWNVKPVEDSPTYLTSDIINVCSWELIILSFDDNAQCNGADSIETGAARAPTFANVWKREYKNSKQETDQTVLTLTKALTKTTDCTCRVKKVEGHASEVWRPTFKFSHRKSMVDCRKCLNLHLNVTSVLHGPWI